MRAHPAGPRHGDVSTSPAIPIAPIDAVQLGELAADVWPITAQRSLKGVMHVGGVDVRDLAAEFQTPLFVWDLDYFRSRLAAFATAFADAGPGPTVFYAAKAFLAGLAVREVSAAGLGIDVCTGGELTLALRAGADPANLMFHGNNKSASELTQALDAGVGRFVIDSFEELVRLAALAEDRGIKARVLIRVTVGVEAHTHEFIATAHEDQKFGFSLAGGNAAEAVRRVLGLDSLELVGLHSHIGSQIFDADGFEVAAHRVVELLEDVRDEHGVELAELDLGGGMGIAYVADDDPLQVEDLADRLRAIVQRETASRGLALPRILVEPGRAIVGPTMVTLYEVGTVKSIDLGGGHSRTYISVDGGMSDNIRTALYDADYTVTLASRAPTVPATLARVVGKHCESGDIVVRDAWLPADVVPSDLLAVAATGAYCRAMASTYNLVPRPAVVAVSAGTTRLVLRRESVDDLLALDVELFTGPDAS
ncbi:MAG: diaminopimelate decarboxylase [Actinomycetes bacterium]